MSGRRLARSWRQPTCTVCAFYVKCRAKPLHLPVAPISAKTANRWPEATVVEDANGLRNSRDSFPMCYTFEHSLGRQRR